MICPDTRDLRCALIIPRFVQLFYLRHFGTLITKSSLDLGLVKPQHIMTDKYPGDNNKKDLYGFTLFQLEHS